MRENNLDLLITLYNIPEMCIFGFADSTNKKIYISYSSNLPSALARIIKDIKYSNSKLKKDIAYLDFWVLEKVTDRKNLRLRYKFYQNKYSNEGWMLYKRDNKLPNYKLRIDVVKASDGCMERDYQVHIKLATRAGKELIVGVFSNYPDALEWANGAYEDKNNIINIVYADNELTKKCLNKWKS
jgi:hypothetical protein